MRGEKIYVKHPRDFYSRIGGLHYIYFDIAQEEYASCLEVESFEVSDCHESEKADHSRKATQHALKAIVFSALCVESAINDYAGIQLGDSYTEKHLKNMDVVSKWVVIPKLVCGKSIDKSGPAFSALRKLIKARNRLVHNKSKEFTPDINNLAESLEKNDSEFKEDFENSLRALYLLCMEMDFLLGQLHNPIKTLDPVFSPAVLDMPEQVKPLFNECKNVVLRMHS